LAIDFQALNFILMENVQKGQAVSSLPFSNYLLSEAFHLTFFEGIAILSVLSGFLVFAFAQNLHSN